jgi:hypothetical protein
MFAKFAEDGGSNTLVISSAPVSVLVTVTCADGASGQSPGPSIVGDDRRSSAMSQFPSLTLGEWRQRCMLPHATMTRCQCGVTCPDSASWSCHSEIGQEPLTDPCVSGLLVTGALRPHRCSQSITRSNERGGAPTLLELDATPFDCAPPRSIAPLLGRPCLLRPQNVRLITEHVLSFAAMTQAPQQRDMGL